MKPSGFSVDFKYICDCETVHWLTQEQVKGSFIIVCDVCHKRISIKPVSTIKVLLGFCNDQSKKVAPQSNSVLTDAHRVLKNMGYSLSSVENVQRAIKAKDKETLIKEFLSRQ